MIKPHVFVLVRVTQTQTKAHTAELQGSSYVYLLIFLGAIGEEDALLHVAVQNLLYCRHVTFNDILHLKRQTVKTQRIRETSQKQKQEAGSMRGKKGIMYMYKPY